VSFACRATLTLSLDIDELFDEPAPAPATGTQAKPEASTQDVKPKLEEDADFLPAPVKAKPKPGRLISNEQPLVDFKRLIEGEGDVFRKAVSGVVIAVTDRFRFRTSRSSSERTWLHPSRAPHSHSRSSASRR